MAQDSENAFSTGGRAGTGEKDKLRIDEPPLHANLPVPIPPGAPTRRPRRWFGVVAALGFLGLVAIGGGYWWDRSQTGLPAGIASGNGRIEADEIDIASKFAGRVAEVLADEGDMVKAGQVVARMDSKDLGASLRKAEAQVLQAQKTIESARADLEQRRSQLRLAEKDLQRARFLAQKDFASRQLLDQRRSELDSASAAFDSAQARIGQAEHALEAARQDAILIGVNIADNTLIAPRDGRIQYRLANVGEVLGAGGKVFTMLDTSNVYMDIFLPTAEAGLVVLGTDARIVLDASPNLPIPAKVTFVASQAQFTPKAVETKSEREKLMFRVRVRIDPELLRAHAEEVRSGLPGIAYVRLDPRVEWPARLRPKTGG